MQNSRPTFQRFGLVLHAAAVLILIGGSAVFYHFVVTPLEGEVQTSSQQQDQFRRLRRRGPVLRQRHELIKQRINKLKDRKEFLERQKPEQFAESEIVRQLTQAAQTEQVVVKLYRRGQQIAAPAGAPADSLLEFHFNCEGDFPNVCRLLRRFDQIPQIADLKQLDMTVDRKAGNYQLQIVLWVYFFAQITET